MIYCISDIHGCYDEFMELLQKIPFSADDTLYVLGDVIDRGPEPVKCLQYIMGASNIHLLMGNHERLMLDAIHYSQYGYEEHIELWIRNGGTTTIKGMKSLPIEERQAILNYVSSLPYMAQVKIGEQNYVLVHAGLKIQKGERKRKDFCTANVISKQTPEDMTWIREDFIKTKALPKSITIFGHTPIPSIKKDRRKSDKVWRDPKFEDKIGIDGWCFNGGCLLALRLDDMKEFAVEKHRNA
jgi:serine/threonine protein phosphatase 1